MTSLEWALQAALLAGLIAALPAAIRLERALSALRRDRAALATSAEGFADATREAEAAISRLRTAADTSGRKVAEQLQVASALREDLRFLTERAEQLANRLDNGVRGGQPAAPTSGRAEAPLSARRELALAGDAPPPAAGSARSRAEEDLLRALRQARNT